MCNAFLEELFHYLSSMKKKNKEKTIENVKFR